MGSLGESASAGDRVNIHIGLFKAEDAEGITTLFRDVYGDRYPIRLYYSPDALTRANGRGDYISVTARTEEGRVIGVHHLFRSALNRNLYEWGVALTLNEFRGRGVNAQLGRFVVTEAIPSLGIDVFFGEAVCNHLHTQKMDARAGCFDATLEIALMPAQIHETESRADGRVAALLQFRTFKKMPHRVFLPKVYEEQLKFTYAELDDQRDFEASDAALPRNNPSRVDQQIFDFAGVARTTFHEMGRDFEQRLQQLEDRARRANVVIFQIWLPLAVATVGEAVEICRSKGYFFGGPLIRWFGEDGFLMQKVLCSPDFEHITLHSDRARTILGMVQEDWAQSPKVYNNGATTV